MIPPNASPSAKPIAAEAPNIPNALFLSNPSSKVLDNIDIAAGIAMAAPKPCEALIKSKKNKFPQTAAEREASPKIASPKIKMILFPQ